MRSNSANLRGVRNLEEREIEGFSVVRLKMQRIAR